MPLDGCAYERSLRARRVNFARGGAGADGKRDRRAQSSWPNPDFKNYAAQRRGSGFCSWLFGAGPSRAPANRCGFDSPTGGWACLARATSLRSVRDPALENGQADQPVHRQSVRSAAQLLVRVVDASPGGRAFPLSRRVFWVFRREISHSP